jgi:hypothetical protein
LEVVLAEGRHGHRHQRLDQLQHGLGVDADLVLGVLVQPQLQEVHQVVEVHRREHVAVGATGSTGPGQLARHAVGSIERYRSK